MPTSKQKNITKDQHYVPQFQLKPFENDKHLIERLNVKENNLLEAKSKKALCCEEFFYSINTGEEDVISQQIEEWLGDREDQMAKKLPSIMENLRGSNQISDGDKYNLATLMALSYLRGPSFRLTINNMMQSGLEQTRKILSNIPPEAVKNYLTRRYGIRLPNQELKNVLEDETLQPEFNNTLHLEMMKELKGFSNMLDGQEWLIYINKSDKPFITSDNPLSPEPKNKEGFGGYGFMEYTYHFPLSPDIHIVTRYPKCEGGKKIHRKTINDEDKVFELNAYVVNSCIETVYANSRSTLEELSQVIAIDRRMKPGLEFLEFLPKGTKKTSH